MRIKLRKGKLCTLLQTRQTANNAHGTTNGNGETCDTQQEYPPSSSVLETVDVATYRIIES